MGKRVADKQLTQLNQDESDSESSGIMEGSFRKANENVLATRVIKKPKSRLRGGPSATAPTLSTNSFAGFTGFGSTAPAAADSASGDAEPPKKKPTFAGFSFGSKTENMPESSGAAKPATSAATGFSFGSFSQSKPAEAAPVSTASSGFGTGSLNQSTIPETQPTVGSGFSFGSSAVSSGDSKPAAGASGFSFGGFGNTKPAETVAKPAASTGFGFGTPATKAEDSKPAATAPTFSFGGFGSAKPTETVAKPTASTEFGVTAAKTEDSKPSTSAPAFSFGGFGNARPVETVTKPAASTGFGVTAAKTEDSKPAATATTTATSFSFGGFGNAKPAETAAKPAASTGLGIAPAKTEEPKPATNTPSFKFGSFGKAEAAEKPAVTPAKTTSGFTMSSFRPPTAAEAANSSSKPSMFAGKEPTPSFSRFVPPASSTPVAAAPKQDEVEAMDEDKDEEYYKNIRGLNVSILKKIEDAVSANAFVNLTPLLEQYKKHWDSINAPPAGSATKCDAKMVEEPKKTEEKPVPSFGTPAVAPAVAAAVVTAPKESSGPPQPKFGFNAAATSPAKPSSGFSFNFSKPSAASGAPTEDKPKFSFGFSKPGESATEAAPEKPKFSFAGIGQSAASKPADDQGAENDAANGDDEEENVDEQPKKPTTAGEEGETTETETRSKLYMWDSEAKQYKDLGIGIFKVNSWSVDGVKRARLLCRQVGSDKLTLNASVFREMITDHQGGKKEVVVMIINDGKPVRYLVRVKTPDMAKALYDVIERVKSEL